MTCGEFKKWLSVQPEDRQMQFRYTESNGDFVDLAVAEAWPTEAVFCVEFESVVTDRMLEGPHA